MVEAQGFHVPAGAGRPTRVPVPGTWFKAVGADTGGGFTLLEYLVAADVPVHTHDREHECLYVLSGEMLVRVGPDQFAAGPGDVVFMPQGVPHALSAQGEVPPRLLVVSSPSGFETFMEDIMEVLSAGHDRSSPEVAEVRARHGWRPS